jgi:GTP:adenosylcobinamide-phosphate guanylyltransferase
MPSPFPIHHPVIILARGYGTRLAPVASGLHKTIEHVGDRSILACILAELRAVTVSGLHLHLREPDPQAAAVAAAHTQPVQISVGPPTGYLPDVVDCARHGDRFTVIEADTITYPGSLTNFLLVADRLGDDVDLCMGVAPAAANPNGPAVVVDEHANARAVSWTALPTGLVPLGAWHWTRRILADAPAFAARSTSIADYITWAIARGARVRPVGFPAGHNINTPDDLARARDQVTAWTTLRDREGTVAA